jgi:hypothetical protein
LKELENVVRSLLRNNDDLLHGVTGKEMLAHTGVDVLWKDHFVDDVMRETVMSQGQALRALSDYTSQAWSTLHSAVASLQGSQATLAAELEGTIRDLASTREAVEDLHKEVMTDEDIADSVQRARESIELGKDAAELLGGFGPAGSSEEAIVDTEMDLYLQGMIEGIEATRRIVSTLSTWTTGMKAREKEALRVMAYDMDGTEFNAMSAATNAMALNMISRMTQVAYAIDRVSHFAGSLSEYSIWPIPTMTVFTRRIYLLKNTLHEQWAPPEICGVRYVLDFPIDMPGHPVASHTHLLLTVTHYATHPGRRDEFGWQITSSSVDVAKAGDSYVYNVNSSGGRVGGADYQFAYQFPLYASFPYCQALFEELSKFRDIPPMHIYRSVVSHLCAKHSSSILDAFPAFRVNARKRLFQALSQIVTIHGRTVGGGMLYALDSTLPLTDASGTPFPFLYDAPASAGVEGSMNVQSAILRNASYGGFVAEPVTTTYDNRTVYPSVVIQ